MKSINNFNFMLIINYKTFISGKFINILQLIYLHEIIFDCIIINYNYKGMTLKFVVNI